MARMLTCRKGHQWQSESDEELSEESVQASCPKCQRTVDVRRNDAVEVNKVNGGSGHKSFSPAPRHSPDPPPDAAGVVSPRRAAPLQTTSAAMVIIPGYEILGELGRGGMGVVYKARQLGLNRVVALKMLIAGPQANSAQMARFYSEAEVLARLQHPNIVQIFDIGDHHGRTYFAMEYVSGGTLGQKMDKASLSPRQAAKLIITLAEAMEAAHHVGIVHRDLKPANVLLTEDGALKIGDFGLAKQLDSAADVTDSNAVLGTPDYMAPEQAWHKSQDVGPPADVYSLGSMLYEMLTGRPPFQGETPLGTVLQVTRDEPVPPSERRPTVPADLETICLKCLQKEPRQRYLHARDLREDLRLFLECQPIHARPISTRERLVKWCRRRPAMAATLAVSTAMVFAMLIVLAIANARLQHERDHARHMEVLASNNQVRAEERELDARRQFDLARRSLYAMQLSQVAATWEKNPALAIELLTDTRHCPFDLRDFAWHLLHSACRQRGTNVYKQPDPVTALAVSPDSKVLAIASGGAVRLCAADSGQEISLLRGQPASTTALAFAPDRRTLAGAGSDQTITLWDLETYKPKHTLSQASSVCAMTFSPDGHWLATACEDQAVRVWDVIAGQQHATLRGHASAVWAVAFSADGTTVASGSADTTVKLWKVATWSETATLQGHMTPVTALGFAPDGATLASSELGTAGTQGGVRLWSTNTLRPLATRREHVGILSLAFTTDGATLIMGGTDGTVRFLDAVTCHERLVLREHGQAVHALVMSPDGQTLATAGKEQVSVRTPARDQELLGVLHGHAGAVTCLAFTPDGETLATAGADQAVRLWSMSTGQEVAVLEQQRWIWSLAFSPDGAWLACGDAAGHVTIWNPVARKAHVTLHQHADAVRALAFAPDGKTIIATASSDRTVKVWDWSSQEVLAVHKVAGPVASLAWSPDGKLLALGVSQYRQPGEVKVLDVASKQEISSWGPFSGKVAGVSFSPDGRLLAASDEAWTLKLWDLAERRQVRSLQGYGLPAFSPDGASLAVAAGNQSLKLLDLSGSERATLKGPRDLIAALAFSPDGKCLATANWTQTITLWRVQGR